MDEIRDHCLCGASLGSMLSIIRLRIDKKGIAIAVFLASYLEVLATFGFNLIFTIILSPSMCEVFFPWAGITINQNNCVAMAGAIAFLSPILATKGEAILRSITPKAILERLLRLWDDSRGSK